MYTTDAVYSPGTEAYIRIMRVNRSTTALISPAAFFAHKDPSYTDVWITSQCEDDAVTRLQQNVVYIEMPPNQYSIGL